MQSGAASAVIVHALSAAFGKGRIAATIPNGNNRSETSSANGANVMSHSETSSANGANVMSHSETSSANGANVMSHSETSSANGAKGC